MTQFAWLTNDPEVAKTLKAIDKIYMATREAAKNLSLDAKIIAYREAKNAKIEAYEQVRKSINT